MTFDLETELRAIAKTVDAVCSHRDAGPEWAMLAVALEEAAADLHPCPLPAFRKVLHAVDRLAIGQGYRFAVAALN